MYQRGAAAYIPTAAACVLYTFVLASACIPAAVACIPATAVCFLYTSVLAATCTPAAAACIPVVGVSFVYVCVGGGADVCVTKVVSGL